MGNKNNNKQNPISNNFSDRKTKLEMSMRRAQRSYHCYGCEHNFKQLVDMNDLGSVKCPQCNGDFIEETRSFDEAMR